MTDIININQDDIVRDSRTIINQNFTNLNTDKAEKTDIQKQAYIYAADTGTANAYAVTLNPAPTAYTTGMRVIFKAANTNTGASTLNVNSLGPKSIKKLVTQDLAGGEILAGAIVEVVYDGTNFQLIAVQSGMVYTSGDQTIGGIKTFTSIPVLPAVDPTTDNQAVRKAYADQKIAIPSGSAQGDILIRDATGWTRLPAGTAGQFLKTQGAGANPIWENVIDFISGQESAPLVTGNVTYTHNLGRTPKKILFFYGYYGDSGNTGTGEGSAESTTSRRTIYRIGPRGLSDSNSVIWASSGDGVARYVADITEITATTFTLNWTTVQTNSYLNFSWLVIG